MYPAIFRWYQVRLTVELVIAQVFYWNTLQKAIGVSTTLNPRTIVNRLVNDFKHYKLPFRHQKDHWNTSPLPIKKPTGWVSIL